VVGTTSTRSVLCLGRPAIAPSGCDKEPYFDGTHEAQLDVIAEVRDHFGDTEPSEEEVLAFLLRATPARQPSRTIPAEFLPTWLGRRTEAPGPSGPAEPTDLGCGAH
jgi:hypothetical protein